LSQLSGPPLGNWSLLGGLLSAGNDVSNGKQSN